jgi:GTPase SAR1 family protein
MNIHKKSHRIEATLLGMRGVGKSTFLRKVQNDVYQDHLQETNKSYFSSLMIVNDDQTFKLKILDIPGSKVKEHLIYLENYFLIFLFYDMTDINRTFNPILEYFELMSKKCLEDITIVLIGTKSDLLDEVSIIIYLMTES